jgi:hypothetical protein
MPSVPRIVRAVPKGAITRAEIGIPVYARIRWHHGAEPEVPAVATAWTREAVEITWEVPGLGLRSDWIPATDVRRSGETRGEVEQEPPRTRAGQKRQRW